MLFVDTYHKCLESFRSLGIRGIFGVEARLEEKGDKGRRKRRERNTEAIKWREMGRLSREIERRGKEEKGE